MDAKEIVRMGLTEYWDGLRKALSGLTATERRFQPHTHANHIDFLVWHLARDEDGEVQAFAQRTSPIFHIPHPLSWSYEGFSRMSSSETWPNHIDSSLDWSLYPFLR